MTVARVFYTATTREAIRLRRLRYTIFNYASTQQNVHVVSAQFAIEKHTTYSSLGFAVMGLRILGFAGYGIMYRTDVVPPDAGCRKPPAAAEFST